MLSPIWCGTYLDNRQTEAPPNWNLKHLGIRLSPRQTHFAGLLDSYGEAKASVDIPAALPGGLRIPIYVSGIVIDPRAPGGVSTVGNTHWFTLR